MSDNNNNKTTNSKKNTKNLKQGSLFSFFSSKPKLPTVKSKSPPPQLQSQQFTTNDNNHTVIRTSSGTTNQTKTNHEDVKKEKKLTNPKTIPSSASSTAANTTTAAVVRNRKWQKLKADCRVAVYWKDDGKYYACTVIKQHVSADSTNNDNNKNDTTSHFHLRYDDGEEEEWVDMSLETFKFIDDDEHLNDDDDDDDDNDDCHNGKKRNTSTHKTTSPSSNKRRRRLNIQDNDDDDDDEEEELEWNEEDNNDQDDDGSVFEDMDEPEDDEDDDDDDQWMVTDDEDEDFNNKKKKKKKNGSKCNGKHKNKNNTKDKNKPSAPKVTRHPEHVRDSSMTPPPAAKRAKITATSSTSSNVQMDDTPAVAAAAAAEFKTPLKSFAHRVSPKTASSQKSTDLSLSNHRTPTTGAKLSFSQQQQQSQSSPQSSTNNNNNNNNNKPLPFVKGAVNLKGAHVHNHLPFLQHPKDINGRTPDHPEYDARTLQVVERDWIHLNGSPMTDAVKQWWDLKSQYFDTILLFKTGKFYELYHMDADVGVEICGLIYMKGHTAHCGFPEAAYAKHADMLVRAGYKVARVEQTETPEQLKQRKQTMSRNDKKPKVVNREVCSIMTLGTRTLCALDNGSEMLLAEANSNSAAEGMGPLLAIREVILMQEDDDENNNNHNNTDDDDDMVRPVCEYGITLVDAIRGTVTLGMFADDILRSRMHTLLTTFAPSEVLIQGSSSSTTSGSGHTNNGASPTLLSLVKAYTNNSRYPCRVETIHQQETFPKSTALQVEHRKQLERPRSVIHPWDAEETVNELHRKRYFPRGSRQAGNKSIARWPPVLQAVVEGNADLCLSSLGAALFFLQRNLIDQEIMTMGIIKAYIPQPSPGMSQQTLTVNSVSSSVTSQSSAQESNENQGHQTESDSDSTTNVTSLEGNPLFQAPGSSCMAPVEGENQISYMSLDGTTLHNLEILTNSVDFKVSGSLWSKVNHTKTPHGARMLRAWLLRPLFRKVDIDRRADAVQALVGGAGALALREARQSVFGKIGDLDRLLSRVHSMSGGLSGDDNHDDMPTDYHPSERAVLYDTPVYTKRKVGDFSKLLNGLRRSCQIPEIFADMELDPNGQLFKFVRLEKDGGFFPDMVEELDWYFENFDCDKAEKGLYEPVRGCDSLYDQACDTIQRVKEDLAAYQDEMCRELSPRHVAKSSWKYINTKPDSKDKYLIELPVQVEVPEDFLVKGKRGSGHKQVIKYATPVVAELVKELDRAYEVQQVRKAKGMQVIFARFDAQRPLWSAAAHVTAVLDAIGSLAIMAENPGYCRAEILECPPNKQPSINIVQGRHPVVEKSFHSSDFIPNDLQLGAQENEDDSARLLLLSGPNMGGKSTMLRQTCLIVILAQIGSHVPAQKCELTPIDCIFTRLGASDRILLGQSTFFVELAETAAALRGATRRSLVIMDELGRGTSTFDGTAIASATVKHLVQRSQCLTLFATHYHSLLEEWKDAPNVRLGHMQCIVDDETDNAVTTGNSNITFLYTLGPGAVPKSFGINVAKLAGLPDEVLRNAKRVSQEFEEEMNGKEPVYKTIINMSDEEAEAKVANLLQLVEAGDVQSLSAVWNELQGERC
ncbi:DNA mismatch repair protein MutS [Nitzschia inconspicua]|uniref:DNA mismatch repair protein n=1 Tax=Nitzschia inconspicua TaxID=303405 RepID=A0A9K3KY35_9STRA|nr:DNA mismatch repair protein MutS [Nitzschia inconspicua]